MSSEESRLADTISGIELAKLHSKAVDYIKSGQPATMHRSLNAQSYPHFMERDRKSYRSNKPVGRIYSRVSIEEFSPTYNMPFDERILTRFELSEAELEKAAEIKAKYDTSMRRLMGQHERPISEFEVWSTFILSKPRVGNDYKLAETVGREVSALKNRFRGACGEAVTGVEHKSEFFSYAGIDKEKLDRFVAAMYTVTHREVQEALERGRTDSEMPLISFPWLFHKELARIAAGEQAVIDRREDVAGDVAQDGVDGFSDTTGKGEEEAEKGREEEERKEDEKESEEEERAEEGEGMPERVGEGEGEEKEEAERRDEGNGEDEEKNDFGDPLEELARIINA